jgi:hypothetical protein
MATPTVTARFMCHTGPLPLSLIVSEISIRMKLQAGRETPYAGELGGRGASELGGHVLLVWHVLEACGDRARGRKKARRRQEVRSERDGGGAAHLNENAKTIPPNAGGGGLLWVGGWVQVDGRVAADAHTRHRPGACRAMHGACCTPGASTSPAAL